MINRCMVWMHTTGLQHLQDQSEGLEGEENGGSVTEAYRGVEHVEHFDGGVFVGGASDVHRLDVRRVVEVDQFFGDLGDWEGANQVSKSGDKTYIKE